PPGALLRRVVVPVPLFIRRGGLHPLHVAIQKGAVGAFAVDRVHACDPGPRAIATGAAGTAVVVARHGRVERDEVVGWPLELGERLVVLVARVAIAPGSRRP